MDPNTAATIAMTMGIGIAAMTQVKRPREIALALLPLVFSVHSFIEVVVWRGVDGGTSQAVLDAVERSASSGRWEKPEGLPS